MNITDPLLWFETKIDDGEPVRVFLASNKGCPFLENLCGICFMADRMVFVSVHFGRVEEELTAHHELDHQKNHGINDHPTAMKLHSKLEERLVSHREPMNYRMSKDLGWKFPRRPRGYGALVASANRWNASHGK